MPADHSIIAILGGTGKEGRGLASRWAAAGYKVIIGSRQLEKAKLTADEINLQLGLNSIRGMENVDAATTATICVLTVVQAAHQEALASLKNALNGKILVDATSRVDYRDPLPPLPPSAAEQAQHFLGSSVRVVGAFQNVPAKSLAKGIGELMDADVLVCSDDLQAAELVVQLAIDAGMRGYYAGRLANSNVVEGLTSILIAMNRHYGIKDASIRITGLPEFGKQVAS